MTVFVSDGSLLFEVVLFTWFHLKTLQCNILLSWDKVTAIPGQNDLFDIKDQVVPGLVTQQSGSGKGKVLHPSASISS